MATLTTPPPTRAPVNNLANQLTAARFVLSLVLFVLIAFEAWASCLVVFVVAAFTDWLDGYLARAYNLGSTLGRNLDPLVDKVLMCGAYISLLPLGCEQKWLFPWMVTVVVARELIITGLRSFLEQGGVVFGADWLGKLKMGLQCAALIAIFLYLYLHGLDPEAAANSFFAVVKDILIYAMLAATALSGLQYLWRAASLLRE